MNKIKRFTAITLSIVLLMSAIPFSVFAESTPKKLYYYYEDHKYEVYKYCKELQLGNNSFAGIKKYRRYFCSFTPQETGVYSFGAYTWAITAETNDNKCTGEDFEETEFLCPGTGSQLFDSGSKYPDVEYELYCWLTAGTTYLVLLFDVYSDFDVTFCGTVTNIEPVYSLTDLIENDDIFINGDDLECCLDEPFEINFSNNTTACSTGFNLPYGNYTDKTFTLELFGFEKVFSYTTISVHDMIDSIEIKDKVNVIICFDYEYVLEQPVTAVINFTDGTSTKVLIDLAWSNFEFEAPNGRTYYISIDLDDISGGLFIRAATGYFELSDYSLRRANFSENQSHYLSRKEALREEYNDSINGVYLTAVEKIIFWLSLQAGILGLRIELLKSLFSFK